jgi:tetratricopeptide (TPR) repeat protein
MHQTLRKAVHCYWLCWTLAISSTLTCFLSGAQFDAGDTVILTRDENLYFHDRVFQQGRTGDTFQVLAHRPATKKVFLSGTGKDGKQIALSVTEETVEIAAPNYSEVRAFAVAAAKGGKFGEALQKIDRALKFAPDDESLSELRKLILKVQTAAQELAAAKQNQPRIAGEVARQRKNAVTVDRANPLDFNDTSNRERAMAMRHRADQMENAAKAAVTDAQRSHNDSLTALTNIPAEKELARQRLKMWTEDPPAIPESVLDRQINPSFEQTLQFINAKLKPSNRRIWFGTQAKKIILTSGDSVFVFDPSACSPEVRYGRKQENRQSARYPLGGFGLPAVMDNYQVEISTLTIECTDAAEEIQFFYPDGKSRKEDKLFLRWESPRNLDAADLEKLANAFSHLIGMFGGVKSAF